MADRDLYLVRNIERKASKHDGVVYEYLTQSSGAGVSRGTPVAYSRKAAEAMARILLKTMPTTEMEISDVIVKVPDDTVVVLDDSARKLPRGGVSASRGVVEGIRTM